VTVSGRGSGRVSLAGLIALRPGARTRLCHRTRVHRGRKGERRSLSETDYIRLIDGAHQMLKAPITLIWDRLNTHVSAAMKQLAAARPWLTVFLLPAYAPELNPVEGVWAQCKRSLANLAAERSTGSKPSSATGSRACNTGLRRSTVSWPRPDSRSTYHHHDPKAPKSVASRSVSARARHTVV
jgi:DDE superfamily endonuclease